MGNHSLIKGHSKDTLADIINLSSDAIISVDGDMNVVLVNAAFTRIFGYQPEEILGQSLNLLLPKKIHSVHKGYIKSYEKSGGASRQMAQRSELFGLSKSGDKIPLDISIQKHPEGGECCHTAICRDVSHRVEQEKRVREEQEKFKMLFNTSHHYTILMDGQGRIVEFNDTAIRNLQIKSKKYIGKQVWDCDFWASEADFSLIRKAVGNLDSAKGVTFIANAFGKNNSRISLEITLKVIWMEYQQSSLIVLEGKNITEVIRSNKALVESEIRLARAQKIARLGNWEWTLATNELIWSNEVYRIFGLTPNGYNTTYEAFLKWLHPEDRGRVEQALADALSGERPYKVTYRIILADGTEKVVEDCGEIVRTEDGYPVRVDGITQDITDRWHKEQELVQAKKHAEEANIAKAQFLSTVGHELRTPLNAIIGFSTMIAEEHMGKVGNPCYRDYAIDINRSGTNLLRQIQDILNITSYELGSLKNHPCHLSAESLLENILPLLVHRAGEKNVKIKTSISDDIPQLYLDPEHTRQILVHLVDNAIKFSSDNGVVNINLSYGNNEFIIDVIDQGIGLEETDFELIFDQFVQKEMSLDRRYGGVGLGLTIVKNLTELQGGRILVKSEAGKGSCFSVCFSGEGIEVPEVMSISQMA